jgi:diadenosine tetraphosphatase ApaH/serine/threonine PP2A family protein phosphatase
MKYDVIGDIHGCFDELMSLMGKLGHPWNAGLGIHIPDGRMIVFVGDITDHGPRSNDCIVYARKMVELGYAFWVEGNHDNKLKRWAKGNKVILNDGLQSTINDLERNGFDRLSLYEFLETLPLYLFLGDDLIVVHASWRDGLKEIEEDKGDKIKALCLYGPTTGLILEGGLPDRIDWAGEREIRVDSPWIVYGHQPYADVRVINRTVGIDTGCRYGGKLTALRWPEMDIVEVKASGVWDKQGRILRNFGEDE